MDHSDPRIRYLAREVEAGYYGNGEERQWRLGRDYNAVQNQVNYDLGYSKVRPEW